MKWDLAEDRWNRNATHVPVCNRWYAGHH
jgi:hypothetical protein